MGLLSRIWSVVNVNSMARRRSSKKDEEDPLLNGRTGENGESTGDGESTLRKRKDLPFEGKVMLPRKKRDDKIQWEYWEILVLVSVAIFALYAFFYFENLHYHIVNGYASLGYASAQHVMGQKYLHGVGVDKDHHTAMEWFKKAADQGHPQASYNVAVGHLKGLRTDLLQEGEPHKLIEHAMNSGVKEAHDVYNNLCRQGKCD